MMMFREFFVLTDDVVKKDLEGLSGVEGFPISDDVGNFLSLSNPPYYTAYPNPYIRDFIQCYGVRFVEESDSYNVKSYVGDVSGGKGDSIYRAHTYHTKVPPKVIEEYIRHYTKPGDIVLDSFCGSGMTGVACRNTNRHAILTDISPIATFISHNYNNLQSREIFDIFDSWKKECREYYITHHTNGCEGFIDYVVWSDVFYCPFCGEELIYWDIGLNIDKTKFLKNFKCFNCDVELSKRKLNKSIVNYHDTLLNEDRKRHREVPVRIYYKYENKNYYKMPDDFDLNLIRKVENMSLPYWVPLCKMMFKDGRWGDLYSEGIEYVHDFYFKRQLLILGFLLDKINNYPNKEMKTFLKWVFTSINNRLTSKRATYHPVRGKSPAIPGLLFVPALKSEYNVLNTFESKLKKLSKLNINTRSKTCLSTQSSTDLSNIPSDSIDYIFIGPPFGQNVMYSELNFIWESWLKVFTNNESELIISKSQNKWAEEFEELLTNCFKEFNRVLKPNRWISVIFHNSKSEMWEILRKSITKTGFTIAQISVLDKKQRSYNQVTNVGSVKNGLIINAYKPDNEFHYFFKSRYGVDLESEFIESYLNKLPVECNVERSEQMLYSKYLAQYLQNDYTVKLDYSDFNTLLKNNFIKRNGYWFTQAQVIEYDEFLDKEDKLKGVDKQSPIQGITSEESAIIWLNRFLTEEPKDFNEIYIEYTKKLLTTQDKIPELKDLLRENFKEVNDEYRIPLNSIEEDELKEMRVRKLEKDFNNLLKEMSKTRVKIKQVREEALKYGLIKLYKEENVDMINEISDKVDQRIIKSNDDMLTIVNYARYH